LSQSAHEPSLLHVDVSVNAENWQAEPQSEAVVERAIAAAAVITEAVREPCEVAVLLTSDAEIQAMNAQWRGIDKATNVLSFPAPAAPPIPDDDDDAPPRALGDIAIAFETVRREAASEDKAFADHLAHLAIHGFLHLIEYDHEDDSHAEIMEDTERRILAALGVADPYAERDGTR
jgi:probable rRNA maturation factor